MNGNMDIEKKEIRGLNLRVITTVISSTVVICAFVMRSYYGIQDSINTVTTANNIQDLKMRTLEIRVDRLETEIEILKQQVLKNTTILDEQKKKQ